jgi:hypothetical protein
MSMSGLRRRLDQVDPPKVSPDDCPARGLVILADADADPARVVPPDLAPCPRCGGAHALVVLVDELVTA